MLVADDRADTAKSVERLMGTRAEARFEFIQERAEFARAEMLDVRSLDVCEALTCVKLIFTFEAEPRGNDRKFSTQRVEAVLRGRRSQALAAGAGGTHPRNLDCARCRRNH